METDKARLTFAPGNWSVAQAVGVRAVNDGREEGVHTAVIKHAATSTDPMYHGVFVPEVVVRITDDDIGEISVTWPPSNEILMVGKAYQLQWRAESMTVPNWQFGLYRNGVYQGFIKPTQVRTVGEGLWEADWRVPTTLPEACDYTISVKDVASGAEDHSEAFCIRQPEIEIVEGPTTDVLYVADELPATPQTSGEGSWNWVNREPVPVSGQWALQARGIRGLGQLWFRDAQRRMAIGPADRLVTQVYLDPARPPKMVMLQYRVGTSWEQRVYWGEDRFPSEWTRGMATNKVRMGNLPVAGRWVRVEVPARILGLEGREINGVGLVLYEGDATFDHLGKVAPAQERLWVDDDVVAGARVDTSASWAPWVWDDKNPKPYFGTRLLRTPAATGLRSHVLRLPGLSVGADDSLFCHVYLDPVNPPEMVMLQWATDSWEHRAYWGADRFPDTWTRGRPSSKRYMGPLPPTGQWVRLSVPASVVGLNGKALSALAFTAFGGQLAWDNGGKSIPAVDYYWVGDSIPAPQVFSNTGETWQWTTSPSPVTGNRVRSSPSANGHQGHYFFNASPAMYITPGDRLVAYVHLDPENPPRMVMLQWYDGNAWTHRAYWGGICSRMARTARPTGVTWARSRSQGGGYAWRFLPTWWDCRARPYRACPLTGLAGKWPGVRRARAAPCRQMKPTGWWTRRPLGQSSPATMNLSGAGPVEAQSRFSRLGSINLPLRHKPRCHCLIINTCSATLPRPSL